MPRLQTLLTAILAGGCLIAHATAQTPTDACVAAPAINNGTYSFSTVGATDDGPTDSCSSTVGSDVWFRYTPVCAGPVSINTCGSNFNTNLDVFNACPSGGGTIVACNDDNPICGGGQLRNRSSLSFNAAGEITYWIRVSGNASDGPAQTGSVVLVVQGPCADAVSYQGRLVSAGVPVNGAVNLQFQLFDAPSDGFPIGPVVEKSNITATDGLVSTLLDIGPGVFVAPRWLQIAVNDPAAGVDFVVLNPRHLIAAAPRAIQAANGGLGGVVIESHVESTGVSLNSTTAIFTAIGGTIRSNVSLPTGTAVMNWSITFYTTVANTGFELRPVIQGAIAKRGLPTRHFLNQASFHVSASGSAVLDIDAGLHDIFLEQRRYAGAGSFVHDSGDSSSWTVTLHRR